MDFTKDDFLRWIAASDLDALVEELEEEEPEALALISCDPLPNAP
ncbi:hypothetical protein [Blastopirellula marina]|nr:hypothetical protein [Blastopirellula marina]